MWRWECSGKPWTQSRRGSPFPSRQRPSPHEFTGSFSLWVSVLAGTHPCGQSGHHFGDSSLPPCTHPGSFQRASCAQSLRRWTGQLQDRWYWQGRLGHPRVARGSGPTCGAGGEGGNWTTQQRWGVLGVRVGVVSRLFLAGLSMKSSGSSTTQGIGQLVRSQLTSPSSPGLAPRDTGGNTSPEPPHLFHR